MIFIRIFANSMEDKVSILDWMLGRLCSFEPISLNDLILTFGDKLSIEDRDILGHWDIGWNVNDVLRLNNSRGIDDLEIPKPRSRYWAIYI